MVIVQATACSTENSTIYRRKRAGANGWPQSRRAFFAASEPVGREMLA